MGWPASEQRRIQRQWRYTITAWFRQRQVAQRQQLLQRIQWPGRTATPWPAAPCSSTVRFTRSPRALGPECAAPRPRWVHRLRRRGAHRGQRPARRHPLGIGRRACQPGQLGQGAAPGQLRGTATPWAASPAAAPAAPCAIAFGCRSKPSAHARSSRPSPASRSRSRQRAVKRLAVHPASALENWSTHGNGK